MGYKLTSEKEGGTLQLSTGEWEMLQQLAASPGGWEPRENRDYTRGRIDPEEASEMADSVREMLPAASMGPDDARTEEPLRTRQGLRESLGYEQDSLSFFGDPHRRYKGDGFVRLASDGASEIILD